VTSSDSFYRAILDQLYDGVYFVDTARRITFWNRGAQRITGFAADHVMGRCCADNILEHVDESGTRLCFTACPLTKAMEDGSPREAEVYLHHADGHRVPVLIRATPLRDAEGRICGAVESFSDNSKLTTTRQHLHVQTDAAEHDALTGLANRRGFERRLSGALAEAQNGSRLGLLFVDVDRFKAVNDRHGHEVGDRVLVAVARTLSDNVRAGDCVGRWGGDEFVVLLWDVAADHLRHVAEKLRRLAGRSQVAVGGEPLRVTLSIGATLLQAGDTAESVMKRVDANLYQSKRGGRNRVSTD
jgi:diguanylate cyclase (GGDEF)-like protein/PAS domain S-box-containing protein